jgi:hypothetical protein
MCRMVMTGLTFMRARTGDSSCVSIFISLGRFEAGALAYHGPGQRGAIRRIEIDAYVDDLG